MKTRIIRDEALLNKGQLVVKARTVLVQDDFGNDKQRYSEIYFLGGGNTSSEAIGLTVQEFQRVSKVFSDWLYKNNEI
jgi:hypothetical protein